MPKRGENIYKRKDNRWEARILVGYTKEGKRKYHSVYGKSYQEIKDKKIDYEKNVLKNMAYRDTNKVTVGLLVEEWLQIQKFRVKNTTYSTYLRIIRSQILPQLGSLPLEQVDENVLCSFLSGKKSCKDGTELASKTVKDISVLLGSILNYGEKKYHYRNPSNNLQIKSSPKEEIIILEEEEKQILTQFILNQSNIKLSGILISLYMGLRLGEICALTWKDIDFFKRTITINKTVSRIINTEDTSSKTRLFIGEPKSNAAVREIPMPDFLLHWLETYRKEASEEKYLLTGSKCMDPRTYQYQFKRVLKQCNIENRNFHCLRHTFATTCIHLGFDIKTLSELLGHSTVNITLNRYVHSSMEEKMKQMNKLSQLVLEDKLG